MATVNKNFRIKHGLIVEGTTGTINGDNILTENGGDSYILNLVGGATLVKSVDTNVFNVDGLGNLTINSNTFDSYGSASTAQGNAEDYADTVAGTAEQNAKNYADGLASNYDPAGSASTAQTNAQGYADTVAGTAEQNAKDYADALTTSDIAEGTNLYFTEGRARDAVNPGTGVSFNRATGYIDANLGTGLNTDGSNNIKIDRTTVDTWYDAAGAATTAENNAKAYTDQEVAALVDSAPALLDTLNELAAAIADNPNYASDVANLVATKADTTYVNSEISGVDTAAQGYASTAQSNAESFATTAANNAQSAAEGYADSLASNYDAAGAASTAETNANSYTNTAVSDLTSGSTQFTAVNVAGYTRQVGQWTNAGTAGVQVTAYSYSTGWGSAEFLVRVMSNAAGHQHSQLSKVLVTTDGAGNVAVTEYGIVTTNGNMGDVTADISGGNVRILVTPQYASSEVIVSGTLLAYND